MKLVIVGAGIAGVNLASSVKGWEVTIISKEDVLPYYRMRLGELFQGKKIEDLYLHPESWYSEKGISLILDTEVVFINSSKKEIRLSDGRTLNYDALVLAQGSLCNSMDALNDRSYTLRSYKDVLRIKEVMKGKGEELTILGGGLLGLELASIFAHSGFSVSVLEYFSYILPRQLDEESSAFLEKLFLEKGIKIVKNAKLESYTDDIVSLEDGRKLKTDILLLSIGVKADIALALKSGINCNRGIVVDSSFRTSYDDIYAIGDCCEIDGKSFGLALYAMEMAQKLSQSLSGNRISYIPSSPSSLLKVAGIDLCSMGDLEGDGYVVRKENIYEKYFIKDGTLNGAVLIGSISKLGKIKPLIKKDVDVKSLLI